MRKNFVCQIASPIFSPKSQSICALFQLALLALAAVASAVPSGYYGLGAYGPSATLPAGTYGLVGYPNGAVVPVDEPAVQRARADHFAAKAAQGYGYGHPYGVAPLVYHG